MAPTPPGPTPSGRCALNSALLQAVPARMWLTKPPFPQAALQHRCCFSRILPASQPACLLQPCTAVPSPRSLSDPCTHVAPVSAM